jgi:glyoxylase-like metal-dependent hydrolase (beta-lactamase superfamily II)
MKIQSFCCGPLATNTYLIYCEATKKSAIIDAAPGSYPNCMQFIRKNELTIQALLLTHSHFDHIADLKKMKMEFSCPIYVHPKDRLNVEHPGADLIPLFFPIEGVIPDKTYQEGDQIQIGDFYLDVIDTPGHSPGSVCLFARKNKILFTGDTLFKNSIGNISLPTADPEKMWASLKKLAQLPSETVVYPGHGSETTLAQENWLTRAKEFYR